MKKIFFLVLIAFAVLSNLNAQEKAKLTGIVVDEENKNPLSGATVKLFGKVDSTIVYNTVTDKKGVFTFSDITPLLYNLEISFSGFDISKTEVNWENSYLDLGLVQVIKQSRVLEGIVIKSTPPPVRLKGDTTEYTADQFKVNPDASSEDIIKKMPGVTVENGTVKVGGEQVQKVTVDGREFFGDDAAATLKNLPADVVDKIQVFDRLSDQAQLTGIDDGNAAKSINIVTKVDRRNGQFGRVFAGFGTDNHYLVGGNMSFFKNARRISLVGLTNDVNQQNFTEMDLLGATSSSNRSGGGGGGGRGNFGGGNNGFLVGQQPGISKTNSLGINYSDDWGKNIKISGSYFFNNRNLANQEFSNLLYLQNNSETRDSTYSSSTNYNHRANFRIEYKIDSANSILITPSVNFQRYTSASDVFTSVYFPAGTKTTETGNTTNSTRDALNFNNNILYRHSFPKKGRTFSVNFSTGINNTDGGTYLDALVRSYKQTVIEDTTNQFTDQLTKGLTLSTSVEYTEPVGKAGILQFNYRPSWNFNKSNQEVYHFDEASKGYTVFDDSLSNVLKNTYNTQRGGVSYRLGDQQKNIGIGIDVQSANLNSDQTYPNAVSVNRSFTNLLPNAMIRYNFSKKSNMRLFYRASTNAPSVSQLQNVIRYSNPLQVSTGNTDLKQNYGHRLGLRYQTTNPQKGRSFFFNLFGTTTSNYVANATRILDKDTMLTSNFTLYKGGQLTKPVNMNGQWSMNTFVTFGTPLRFMKTNMNFNLGYVLARTPGIINDTATFTNSNTYNTGIVLASNISQYVDFTLSYNAAFNKSNSTSSSLQTSNDYVSQNAGFRLNLLSKKGWLFNNDISNQSYTGLTAGFNQSYWLWNMAVAKKFLKNQKAELRLSAFDLLNQNQSISRTIDANYIEDVQTQVVKQYFMLTFTLNLKNFGKAPANNRNNSEGFDRGRFGPPGGGRPPGE